MQVAPYAAARPTECCKKRLLDYSELPGFADLGAVTVSVACQANEFAKICSRLVVVAYRFSRLSGSVETAHPLRRTIHRGFVFDQRCGRVALFQQKIGEQLAHWIQPIFHRHVFLAIVFAVRCGAHQLHSFCPATLCVRVPTLCGENLYVYLPGPIRVTGLSKRGAELLEPIDVRLGSGKVAGACSSNGTGEIGNRFGGQRRHECGHH